MSGPGTPYNMTDEEIKRVMGLLGERGGLSKSEAKRSSARDNLAKARERKLLYRLDPSKRPAPKAKE